MAISVFPGRFTAKPSSETITVFLIGVRANRWWKLVPLIRTASAMPRMLNYLGKNPDVGMLGFHQWLGRTTLLLSYWESPEHLQKFAACQEGPHLAPWRKYMKLSAGSGDVGVWHETYQINVNDQETIYNDMPSFGLAAATHRVPVGLGKGTARKRLGRS